METEEEGGGSGPHSQLSGVNNEKFNQEKEEVEDHSPGDPHSGVNNEQVPEEEEGMESNKSSLPCWLPSVEDYQCLVAHFKQFGDPQLKESFEKIIASASATLSDNWFESGHRDILRKHLYPKNSVGVQADGQEPSVTLTWSDFKDLVELYAKDDQRRAELLESKRPSQNLLEVQAKQEQVDILPLQGSDPETSFSLTGSEFRTVVEALATDEQKLTRFVSLLDLGKDVAIGNDLPLMQRAESVVLHYQRLPESSKEKLLSALYNVGLSLSAKAISLQSKKQ